MTLHLYSHFSTACLFFFFCIFCDLRSPLDKKKSCLIFAMHVPVFYSPSKGWKDGYFFSSINAGWGTWWYPWFDHRMVVEAHKWLNYNLCTSAVICPHPGVHRGTCVMWHTLVYALFRTNRVDMFEICIYLVFYFHFLTDSYSEKCFPELCLCLYSPGRNV